MTPQAEILTKILARTTDKGVMINPFFGATEDEIRSNFHAAEVVYVDVFKAFISAWWQIGDRTIPPPKEWEHLAI